MIDTAGLAQRHACPLQHRDAEHLWGRLHNVLIASQLFVDGFAVTQIASETTGLALDVIAPPTRCGARTKGSTAER